MKVKIIWTSSQVGVIVISSHHAKNTPKVIAVLLALRHSQKLVQR